MNYKESWVKGNGHRIDAREYPGQGPAIVLLHGFPDNLHLYDRLLPHLHPPRRVITFDLLGWGGSDKPTHYPYTATNQTGDLDAVIDQLGLQRVTVVVHDASGPPGIDWALEHPGGSPPWCCSTPGDRRLGGDRPGHHRPPGRRRPPGGGGRPPGGYAAGLAATTRDPPGRPGLTEQAAIDHARHQITDQTSGHGLDVLINAAGTRASDRIKIWITGMVSSAPPAAPGPDTPHPAAPQHQPGQRRRQGAHQ